MKRWKYYGSGAATFNPTFVGSLTLAEGVTRGVAYCPVNNYVYVIANETSKKVVVIDPTGSGSVVTTITGITNAPTDLAYLPNANKIVILSGTNSYQEIDCSNNTLGSVVNFSGATFTLPANAGVRGSSFSVDPSNDDLYLIAYAQGGKLTPATGVLAVSALGGSWRDNTLVPCDIAYNPVDGKIYIICTDTGHMFKSVDTSWALITDFTTVTKVVVGSDPISRLWINRASGKVWFNQGGGAAGTVLYYADSTTLSSYTLADQPGAGDWDPVLQSTFALNDITNGILRQYNSSDVLVTTSAVGNSIATPSQIVAAYNVARYLTVHPGTAVVKLVNR